MQWWASGYVSFVGVIQCDVDRSNIASSSPEGWLDRVEGFWLGTWSITARDTASRPRKTCRPLSPAQEEPSQLRQYPVYQCHHCKAGQDPAIHPPTDPAMQPPAMDTSRPGSVRTVPPRHSGCHRGREMTPRQARRTKTRRRSSTAPVSGRMLQNQSRSPAACMVPNGRQTMDLTRNYNASILTWDLVLFPRLLYSRLEILGHWTTFLAQSKKKMAVQCRSLPF